MKTTFLRHGAVQIIAILCSVFSISCTLQKTKNTFTEQNNVEASVWIESNSIKINQIDTLIINKGEYSVNDGEWLNSKNFVVSEGDQLKVRVMSSKHPNDVTICEVIVGNDSMYFQVKTKAFEVPVQTNNIRNINLGLSGPDMDTLGGPGANWWRYNSNKNKLGSAVNKGLVPNIQPLFNAQIRDAVVCVGGDGRYYLTGSSGDDIWHFNDGVELWVSDDLIKWDYMGLIWSFEKDGTWEKKWRFHNGAVRALWAPEIHYVKGNYYITHSMPPGDRGLLKSTTGKPEGPYVNALTDDGKWNTDIDGSLFEDEDGSVYYLYGGGWIARMKDDMSGLAEEPVKPILLDPDMDPAHHASTCPPKRNCQDIGREGAFMFKRNGLYYLTAADTYEGRYSSLVAVSDSIYGPYKWRHEAVPCGGGTSYFKDHNNQWWCTYFGNDNQSPFREMPAMIKVDFTKDGKVFPAKDQPYVNAKDKKTWESNWEKIWKNKYK